ncbi:MAG: hypothetical protein IMZ71_01475 [Chloroflexi bacterium]|nr:hypothetical protein [Chloroflexota bacterium]
MSNQDPVLLFICAVVFLADIVLFSVLIIGYGFMAINDFCHSLGPQRRMRRYVTPVAFEETIRKIRRGTRAA